MIVKTISIKNPDDGFRNLLKYMLFDEGRLFDEKGKSFMVTHNVRGRTLEEMVASFKENEKYRYRKRKDSVYVHHEMLSFHRDDSSHLSLKKLEDMAREYIKLRNPKGIYVVVPHFDKDHYHLHIACSGITYKEGRANRMSWTDLAKLKRDIQEYQIEKYPELKHSVVNHGKRKAPVVTDKEQRIRKRGKQTFKEQLSETIGKYYKQADSLEAFIKNLKGENLKVYYRAGKLKGVWYKKKRYRFKTLGYPDLIRELTKQRRRGRELEKLQESQDPLKGHQKFN